MDLFPCGYILVWTLACLTSIIILVKDKSSFELFHRDYWRFLMVPSFLTVTGNHNKLREKFG
jgi:hypothetical protein